MSCPEGTKDPTSNNYSLVILMFLVQLLILVFMWSCLTRIFKKFRQCYYSCKFNDTYENVRLQHELHLAKSRRVSTMFTDLVLQQQHVQDDKKPDQDLEQCTDTKLSQTKPLQNTCNNNPNVKLNVEMTDSKQNTNCKDEHCNERRKSRVNFTMDIRFEDLTLRLKSNKKIVVDHASGKINAGTVTAIMGPSGAGKTSFLYTLSGKASQYGKISGKIFINGEKRNLSDFTDVVGFVPQNDIMTSCRTVREVLRMNADFRLGKKISSEKKNQIVEDVMHLLGLYELRDTLIGDETKRGISGGQKKRVNIGMELVAEPSVLFCDEPTSGLDATTSGEIMKVLQAVASRGTMVVVVLHQPRYEIFEQFDNVILLSKGGKTAYMGPTHASINYFQSLGYIMPKNMNPADYLMDVLSGTIKSTNNVHNIQPNLALEWTEKQIKQTKQTKEKHVHVSNSSDLYESEYAMVQNPNFKQGCKNSEYRQRKRAMFHSQVWLITKRAFTIMSRQKLTVFTDIIMFALIGYVVALCINTADIIEVPKSVFLISFASSFCAATVSLRLFGDDKIVFWRYAAVGINKFAYYFGMNVATIPWMFIQPVIFLLFFWPIAMPRGKLIPYYICLFVNMLNAQALGQLVSVLVDSTKATLLTVALVMMATFVSGFVIPLSELGSNVKMLSSLSFSRWFQEALYNEEINVYVFHVI